MRRRLLWIAGMTAAALPVCQPVFGQYVTKPDMADFAIVTTIRNGSDAQTESVDRKKQTVDPTKIAGCPVAMRAQRMAGGAAIQAGDHSAPVAGQQIHLEIEGGEHAVVEARVTVHGTRAQGRLFPAVSSPGAKGVSEAVKSFTLRPRSDDAERIASSLQLEGFTSVQSVTLDSVTYADGSVWKAAAGRACSMEPDPLMLVGRR